MKKITEEDFICINHSDKFHVNILKEAKKDPSKIEPNFPYYDTHKLPNCYPIYKHIKYPSGNFNYFGFNPTLIVGECERQIKGIKEQLKYLEECKAKFEYFAATPEGFVAHCMPRASYEDNDGEFIAEGEIFENLLEYSAPKIKEWKDDLAAAIDYKKSLLAIEEKYSIPSAGIVDLEKAIQKKIEPIQWLQSERQFAWLIEQLADQGYIKSENKWVKAVKHFVNKEGKEFKADSLNSKAAENRDLPEKSLSIPLKKIQNIVKKIPSNKE